MQGTCLLAWKVIFDMRKIWVLSVFPPFSDGDWSVCGCMCVYTHTHTHAARGVLRGEPRGRDETLGEPEESRWTKNQDKYIRICERSTHVYINAGRLDEILD